MTAEEAAQGCLFWVLGVAIRRERGATPARGESSLVEPGFVMKADWFVTGPVSSKHRLNWRPSVFRRENRFRKVSKNKSLADFGK
ncbi:MAG TPA: hypothetical protein VK627_08740 [Edaphobacter sp.]|jgi:hypothetical protein|nr:hypothetical protein [Edaphobacter sp.]